MQRKEIIGQLIIGLGVALAIIVPVIVDTATKKPELETPLFLLGGVIITGLISLVITQIQIISSENREERNRQLDRKEKLSALQREALHRRISQAEEKLKFVIDDFAEMEQVLMLLKLYLELPDNSLSVQKFIEIIEKANTVRNEINPNIRQISMAISALPNSEINTTWTSILQIRREMNNIFVGFTDKLYEFFETNEIKLGLEDLPEADTQSLNVQLQLLTAKFAITLDKIWASDFD